MSALAEGYSYAAVAELLAVPESKLRYWAQTGFVGPSLRRGNKLLFSFRDLVSVKAAKELTERGFKTAEIRKALTEAQKRLPSLAGSDRPLDRLRVAFDGETLVVVEEGAAFEVSGQRVFDFGLGELATAAHAMRDIEPQPIARGKAAPAEEARTAYDWFVEALRLSQSPEQEAEAEAAYRKALSMDPALAAASTNLGTLLFRRGDAVAAKEAFEAALASDPEQAEARYNLANILLEEGHAELAVAELRRVLMHAPEFADAHYNLASALETLGSRAQAREHLRRYLELARASEDDPYVIEARQRLERLGS